jgi:tetratricopeptide (TPR) repeat protein
MTNVRSPHSTGSASSPPASSGLQRTRPITVNKGQSVQPHVSAARWSIVLAGSLIVLAALAAYHNSFSVPFIFDDEASIVDNPTIRHMDRALLPPPDGTTGGRPILNLTFALNYALGGLDVWGYHSLNLLIHTLAGLVLFGIVRRTLLRPPLSQRFGVAALPLALAVAVIWVVHPLQTESVTYVVQRAESLMGLFYLLMLYCFIRGVESGKSRDENPSAFAKASADRESSGRVSESKSLSDSVFNLQPSALWFSVSVFFCLLGMASKEVMVSAPLLVMLYDRTFVAGSVGDAWRRRSGFYLGLASCWFLLGYLVVSTGGTRGGSAGFGNGMSWWMYALTQFEAIVHYLWLSVWPHPLIFDYGNAVIGNPLKAIPYALAVGLLAAGTMAGLRRWPAMAFAGMWFFAILAPSSSVVPVVTETMAEHRMYLPLAAVIVLAVLGSYAWVGWRSMPVLLTLAVVLGFFTERRNAEYRNTLAFWRELVARLPDNARARNNLGLALSGIPGQMPEAVTEFEAALRINPDFAKAHNNLGNALMQISSQLPEAIAQYEAALRINPDFAKAHNNLGNALMQISSRLPEAIAQYEAALRINPDFAEAHYNLGVALMKSLGRWPEAMAEFKTALQMRPDYAEAHYGMALALSNFPGRLSEAVAEYKESLRINPDRAEVHYGLGNALMQIPGRSPEAIAEYEETLRINPDFAEAHYNLGCALGDDPGRLSDAIRHFQAAARIKPNYADAHYNLANALMNIPGRWPEAIAEYEAVLRINPDDAEAHNNLGWALSNDPGRLPDAIAHFQAAVQIKPDYAEAHKNLGMLLSGMPGKVGEAIAEFETALRIDPSLESARQKLAELHAARK